MCRALPPAFAWTSYARGRPHMRGRIARAAVVTSGRLATATAVADGFTCHATMTPPFDGARNGAVSAVLALPSCGRRRYDRRVTLLHVRLHRRPVCRLRALFLPGSLPCGRVITVWRDAVQDGQPPRRRGRPDAAGNRRRFAQACERRSHGWAILCVGRL